MYQLGYFDLDVESTEVVAPWPVVMFSAVITVVLLYSFRRYYLQRESDLN